MSIWIKSYICLFYFQFSLIVTEGQNCYDGYLKSGKTLFNSGKFDAALNDFKAAKNCPGANQEEIAQWVVRVNTARDKATKSLISKKEDENKRFGKVPMEMAGEILFGSYSYQHVYESRTDLFRFFNEKEIANAIDQYVQKSNVIETLADLGLFCTLIPVSAKKYEPSKIYEAYHLNPTSYTLVTPLNGEIIIVPAHSYNQKKQAQRLIDSLAKTWKDGDKIIIKNIIAKMWFDNESPYHPPRFVKNGPDMIKNMVFEITIGKKDTDKDSLTDDIDFCLTTKGPLCNGGCPLNPKESANVVESLSDRGVMYKTVTIGSQTWLSENLNVTFFQNGDPIPEAKTDAEWAKANNEGKPVWCYYDNNEQEGKKHGKIYNWYAVNDPRKLAIKGYHIPNTEEWNKLINYLGGEKFAGVKMTDKQYSNTPCSNISGFNGLYSGFRAANGRFLALDDVGYWYSKEATESSSRTVYFGGTYRPNEINMSKQLSGFGHHVRCVKD